MKKSVKIVFSILLFATITGFIVFAPIISMNQESCRPVNISPNAPVMVNLSEKEQKCVNTVIKISILNYLVYKILI
jgi:hypothetical protein